MLKLTVEMADVKDPNKEPVETFENELENELYKEKTSKRPGSLKNIWGVQRRNIAATENWRHEESEESLHTSVLPVKKLFLFSFIVFLLSASVFGFVLFWRMVKINNVSIELSGPSDVSALSPVAYTIQLKNKSKYTLENTVLTVDLGDGAYFEGDPTSKTKQIDIGAFQSGDITSIPLPLFFAGKTNQVTEIKATVEYMPPKKNQRFSVDKKMSIAIKKGAFDFQASFPNQVFVQEPFKLSFSFANITNQQFGLKLSLENPGNFDAISFVPENQGDLSWDFPTIAQSEKADVVMVGKFSSIPINPIFTVIPTLLYQGQEFQLEGIPVAVKTIDSPVVLHISSYPENKVMDLNQQISYTVSWENKSSISLQDVSLHINFNGPFDFSDIKTDGYFSSSNHTLVWDARNKRELNKILPKSKGSVTFQVGVPKEYPIFSPNDKDFPLSVSAQLQTQSIPPEVQILSSELVVRAEDKKILQGNASLAPSIIFYDNIIQNSGPFPPTTGSKTTLTVHMKINSIAEGLENIQLKTHIPIGVQLTGVWGGYFDPQNLSYNQKTGDFLYQIKDIAANHGVIYEPIDIAFQIEITPPLGDFEKFTILDSLTFSAQGTYSKKTFSQTLPAVNLEQVIQQQNEKTFN